jgi:O-antigen/teichoic acid export membrane protein
MSLARNTAYNLIGSAIPLAASLVTVPIYLKVIGLERYGLLAICWVVLGYMEVFEFGLGMATAQRIALLKDSGREARSESVWGSLALSLILGAAGALLLAALGPAVLHATMEQRSSFTREVADSIVWLALLVPLTTCHSALAGALQGRERFLRLNLIRGIGSAAFAVAPLAAAISFGPSLRVLIVALVAVRASTVVTLLVACRSAVPLRPAKLPSPSTLKSLLGFGGWVTGEGLLAPLLLSAEKLAIGWFRTATAVSLYMIPFNILSRLLLLPQSLAAALIPRFAGMDETQAEQTTREALRNLELLTAPVTILALLLFRPFLWVWIGPTLAEDCTPVGIILIVGFWFNALSHVPYAQLIGTGRPDLVVKIALLQLLPYLALLYVILPNGGVIGAALAWSIRNFLELMLFLAATRELRLLNQIILVPAILVLAAAVVAFFAPPPGVAGTVTLLVIAAAAVVRMLEVLPTERSEFLQAVRSRGIR